MWVQRTSVTTGSEGIAFKRKERVHIRTQNSHRGIVWLPQAKQGKIAINADGSEKIPKR